MPPPDNNMSSRKRCFVIMGFGLKTDFATGRKLDLNKSYKLLIKPVVEQKGLECVRADEILHSGSIDYQMYKELLNADVVIADLSTANVNAFYELGIRHALRKRNTIVISEDKLGYPFDLNHVKITSYTHLGEAIDYEEVERFREILGETLEKVLKTDEPDSPVYTHLQELTPPMIKKEMPGLIRRGMNFFYKGRGPRNIPQAPPGPGVDNPTLAVMIEQAEAAMRKRDYENAKVLFGTATKLIKDDSDNDPYLIQRLAFATYKAKVPDVITALFEAMELLSRLGVEHTNDTETVSLAGRVQKKLFEMGHGDHHLAEAIQFYMRGYFLLQNRYHGINLAFLLNRRADSSLSETNEDRIADMVFASRIRRQVLKMCEKDWNEIHERKKRIAAMMSNGVKTMPEEYDEAEDNEQLFWTLANKAECHYGLDEMDEYKKAHAQALAMEHTEWMLKAYEDDHAVLQEIMKKHGHLLNPKWKGEG